MDRFEDLGMESAPDVTCVVSATRVFPFFLYKLLWVDNTS